MDANTAVFELPRLEQKYAAAQPLLRMYQGAGVAILIVFGVMFAFGIALMVRFTPEMLYWWLIAGNALLLAFNVWAAFRLGASALRFSRSLGLSLLAFSVFGIAFILIHMFVTATAQAKSHHPQDFFIPALFAVLDAWLLYAYQIFARGGAAFAFTPPDAKRIIADVPEDAGREVLQSRLLGLNVAFKHIRRRGAVATAMLAGSSAGFAIFGMLLYFIAPVFALTYVISEGGADFREPMPGVPEGLNLAVEAIFKNAPAVVALATPLALLAAIGLQRAGRRRARVSIQSLQQEDPRPPILFLRAFGDDQVALRPPRLSLPGYLFDLGQRKTNLDVLVLEEGTDFGPVVALGNPKDPVPPYGAARGYFTGADWQDGVRRLASDSIAIILCVDETDGVWWEVDYIGANGLMDKTLVLLHPKFAASEKNAALLGAVATRLGVGDKLEAALAREGSAKHAVLGFFTGPGGEIEVGRSREFTRISYQMMLRWFLRTRLKTV